MSQKFEGSRALLAGPFMLSNGSGPRFDEYESFDNNDTQVADVIAEKQSLRAVMISEARIRNRERMSGALAIYYDGLTQDNEVVHGVYFVDEQYRGGLPEAGITALGAHALRVTPQGEVGYCEPTLSAESTKDRLANYGYHTGDNTLADVLHLHAPAAAEMSDHAADTA